MSFHSLDFRFDGINSKNLKLKIVSVDNSKKNSQFGVEQEIVEDNSTNIPLFLGVKRKCPTIPITMMKMNDFGNAESFTDKELDNICRWLFQDEYKPFISWDNTGIIYYVIFTKGDSFYNCAKEGYLNLEMRLNAPHGYSNQLINFHQVTDKKVIELHNGSNINTIVYPDIEFELLGDNRNLKITNLSNGDFMEFEGLEKNEHAYVYNDGIKDIMSKVDKNRNLFKNFNKKWISMRYGKNRIEIIGNCRIKFISQYPTAMI